MSMFQSMTIVAKGVAAILLIMSMWSIGVAIERIFTYTQARNQSKLFAPQVAKHLKAGRLTEAIAMSSSKTYGDGQLVVRVGRLFHQEDGVKASGLPGHGLWASDFWLQGLGHDPVPAARRLTPQARCP